MQATYTLDKFDIKILSHLQIEGRCKNVDLANIVGLSQSPCLARLKKLEEAGYILGYGADIALDKLGNHVTILSEVTINNHRPSDFRKFERGISQYQEIIECYNVSGGYDYLLKIVTPGISYYQSFMEQLLKDDIGIQKYTNRVVLRQPLKRRDYPLNIITRGS